MAEDSNIEVDPALAENASDSSYESSGYNTSTDSLTSSIYEYVYENGRRYHSYYGTDKNPLPTDEVEQDRMDLHHEMIITLLGGLHKAPIGKAPQRILDIGTGTGIWAIDMADRYPMAEVTGVDLSPIQPKWMPPNCRFEVDDAEQDWTYKPEFFDFVHARNVGQAISDWPKLMGQIYKATSPGGYVELSEIGGVPTSDDGSMKEDNGTKIWFQRLSEAIVALGKPATMDAPLLRANLENAGFIDVVDVKFKLPLAPWPRDRRLKHLGAMNLLSSETGYSAYGSLLFTRVLGMTQAASDKLCHDAFRDAKNKNFHLYQYYHVVYGRKPE